MVASSPQGKRPPERLVENRTSFGARDVEFSIYDTYTRAERVELSASNPLYCGMCTGRKVIHLKGTTPFPFLPHESLVVPSGQPIYIDFPEADEGAPTTCLSIEVDQRKVKRIVDRLNERLPRSTDSGTWAYSDSHYSHFANPHAIDQVLDVLTYLFTEDHPYRDDLIDVNVEGLLVRMLQTESRHLLIDHAEEHAARNGLAAAVTFVRGNLHRHIEVSELAEAACMSEPSIYRYFRSEFGMTPVQFINSERMKVARKALLVHPYPTVTEVSYQLGFSSVSHFIRLFRRYEGTTPKQYQSAHASTTGSAGKKSEAGARSTGSDAPPEA